MKKLTLTLACLFMALSVQAEESFKLLSPDKNLEVTVNLTNQIFYSVKFSKEPILTYSNMQLVVNGERLGENPQLIKSSQKTVDELITPAVPLKFSTIRNNYNQLLLKFRGGYSVEFRAFNDGFAYRFLTEKKGTITVNDEVVRLQLGDDFLMHVQEQDGFSDAYEGLYSHLPASEWDESHKMSSLPILMEGNEDAIGMLFSEADLIDYPGLHLKGLGKRIVTGTFAPVLLEYESIGFHGINITKEADYIAKTRGTRAFPWRYMNIGKNVKNMMTNTLGYRLAPKCGLSNTAWIKPGKAFWDVDIYHPLEGEQVRRLDTKTYKEYIDIAAKYGIEYLLLDYGWAVDRRIAEPHPGINMSELVQYANNKGVGILVWLPWWTVQDTPDVFAKLEKWGVKGMKIDFMNHDDQWMVNFYERAAQQAAKHHLIVDFHGAYKPAGLEHKYPNVLSYEAVRATEYLSGCLPNNSLYYPIMRNAVGPMDYTPGALLNAQTDKDAPKDAIPGTRVQQLAMFMIFESGLQLMVDSPTRYAKEDDYMRFVGSLPTTWDETIPIEVRPHEFLIVARRKGNKWYLAGMRGDKSGFRSKTVVLRFLEEGKKYKMTTFEDGANVNDQPSDHIRREYTVQGYGEFELVMGRNGGFIGVIEEQ